jgi:hypothetical protein
MPGHKHSGKHQPKSSSLTPIGNRRIRQALWMPTLSAVTRNNPWLMTFYRRPVLRQRRKPKVGTELNGPLGKRKGNGTRRVAPFMGCDPSHYRRHLDRCLFAQAVGVLFLGPAVDHFHLEA